MADHLGYDKHAVQGRNRANSRNGKRSKTVLTYSCGEVDIDVPRDRDGSLEPQLVKKRQRRLGEVDEVVLTLYAKWLTTGRISRPYRRRLRRVGVQGHGLPDHRPGDRGDADLVARPLEKVDAAIFIDAIMVKIRDGQVRNRTVYAAIGVDLDGHKEVLAGTCS